MRSNTVYKLIKIAVYIWMLGSSVGWAATSITVWEQNLNLEHHRIFLELAASKAESKYGDIQIVASEPMTQEQAFSALKQNNGVVDIAVGGLSSDREEDLLPIYYPIDRGLLGFRICLINPDMQSAFDLIQTPQDFKTNDLNIGIGEFWPDAFVLQYNGIPLETARTKEGLIKLLRNQDIACYSRGINELMEELQEENEFVLENRVMLIYPMADLIYARNSAHQKHEMLEYGLSVAIEDGSFAELFSQFYGDAMTVFSVYQRKLMFLDNPDLSEDGRAAINQLGIASFTGVSQ